MTQQVTGNIPDDRCQETIWERKTNINLKSFSDIPKYTRKSEYMIYTDGSMLSSQTDTGVGSGY